MSNGVKPRFDRGGTEFGLMHRDLPPGYLMFDIDRLHARCSVDLSLKRENEGFVEYRRKNGRIEFIALMEVKQHRTPNSERALNTGDANAMARIEMARRLGCRLFVVFATSGRQPFEFYEFDVDNGNPFHVGTLRYGSDGREEAVRRFWTEVLRIT